MTLGFSRASFSLRLSVMVNVLLVRYPVYSKVGIFMEVLGQMLDLQHGCTMSQQRLVSTGYLWSIYAIVSAMVFVSMKVEALQANLYEQGVQKGR